MTIRNFTLPLLGWILAVACSTAPAPVAPRPQTLPRPAVDASAPACALVARNAARNGVQVPTRVGDAREVMQQLINEGASFDMVFHDPPAPPAARAASLGLAAVGWAPSPLPVSVSSPPAARSVL